MIPIYLCEDDINQLDTWKNLINNTVIIKEWDMEIKASCSSPESLLSIINRNKPENAIYFLDVDLKSNMNGIQLAVEIRKYDPRGFIIFITTHDEMAVHTFKYRVEPLGYIIKESPLFKEQIEECLQNVFEKYQVPNNPISDILTVRMERKVLIVPFDDIYYIEPSPLSHKIKLHKGYEILEFTSTLAEVKAKLDDRFVMCHKAYIVNCHHIRRVDRTNFTVYFDNNKSCPCSVRQSMPLCQRLEELHAEEAETT